MRAPASSLIEIEGCPRPRRSAGWFTVAGVGQWDRGVCLADEDTGTEFDGMYDPPVSTIYNATAFEIGSTFGGAREDSYDFVLAFHVLEDEAERWRYNDSEFRLAWDYRLETKIHVTTEESHRYLPVRLAGKPKLDFGYDPNGERYSLVRLPLKGAYPRWLEPDFTDTFVTTTSTVSGGTETGSVTVSNPCDTDMWLKWVLQATGAPGIRWTLPDYSFGNDQFGRAVNDAARKIVMPALIDGENVLIDTDELARTGQVNSSLDTEIYLRMNGVTFMYKIPPYTTPTVLPISVSNAPVGAGVQVRCPREWTRPWGLE